MWKTEVDKNLIQPNIKQGIRIKKLDFFRINRKVQLLFLYSVFKSARRLFGYSCRLQNRSERIAFLLERADQLI